MKIKKNINRIFSCLVVAMMLITTCIPGMGLQVTTSAAETSTNGNFTLNGDTLSITSGSDKIDLQVCSSKIMRVNFKPGGVEDPDTIVIDPDKKWETGNIVSSDLTSDPVVIKTSDMTIKVGKSNLSVSVYNASNKLLLEQKSFASKSVTFSHSAGQTFYGITGTGAFDHKSTVTRTGDNVVFAGGQGHCAAPFTWTTSGYGLLVDSIDGNLKVEDTSLSYTAISKVNTEYYVMVGDPTDILSGEAQVSGTSPMYPKWATGFTNTQWMWTGTGTYEDQLKEVISKYRDGDYPIDNFCLDFDWKNWGTGDYGEFSWNAKNFPGGPTGELKKYMDNIGLKMTGIQKPRLFKDTAEAAEADKNNWWFTKRAAITDYCAGPAILNAQHQKVQGLDYSIPSARAWWWEQEKPAFDTGMIGFWNDECDAAPDNGFGSLDGLYMQKANYDGQTAYTDKQRVWSINRNYYAGAQRYGYGLWSGDISSGFSTMKDQKDNMISAINLGEAKWGMDTGGFNGHPTSENYARWMEFSAFVPIFRVHGTKKEVRYPWAYGDIAASAAKDVMQLRYKLIPYIYKYDHQASTTGIGLVKSLMMAYPNDENTKDNTDAWMFGDYMLVSPVLESEQTSKSIYLPEGNWIDYKTGKTYKGKQTIDYAVDSKTWKDVPLFIKQGAIIPSQDYEDYVGEKVMSNIYVDAFPDAKTTSFEYYDDDGNSTSYKDGNYFKQNFTLSKNNDWSGVQFTTGAKEGTYTPDVKNYIVKLHVKATGAVTVGGEALKKYETLDALQSASGEGYATGTDVYGDVVYAKVTAGKEKTINAPCDSAAAPEQTATVYAKTTGSAADLQYSVDGGSTWSAVQPMIESDKLGFVQSKFTYKLKSNNPVYVRYVEDDKYYPSSKGVALSGDGSEFTIAKDGTISVGAPTMNTSNLYIKIDKASPVIIQYKDKSGTWSDSIQLDAYGTAEGQYFKSLSYPSDESDLVVRYSEDVGQTWKPSSSGKTISSGDYMNNSSGDIVSGNPKWTNGVIIYYKKGTITTPYVHWKATGGTWTTAPGDKMTDSSIPGYAKAVLDLGTATSAEVCFNDGKDVWDSNDKKNYTFQMGINTYDAGKITQGDPNGTVNLKVTPSIKGGNYTSKQTVSLTASDASASIYYTLDGKTPSISSKKYSGPITISANTTLEAIAVDAKGNKSPVAAEKYTIGTKSVDPVDPVVPTKPGTVTVDPKPSTVTEDPKKPSTVTEDPKSDTEDPKSDTEDPKSDTEDPKSDTVIDPPVDSIKALETVTISPNIASVKLGDTITFTANADTEDTSVKYAFGYFDESNNWKKLSNFSSSNTFEWTTDAVGSFKVIAMVSDNVKQINSSASIITVSSNQNSNAKPEPTFDNNSILSIFAIMTLAVGAAFIASKRKRIE